MNYDQCINKYLDREVLAGVDYLLQDDSDGKGIYIKFWNVRDKTEPTIEQLNEISVKIIEETKYIEFLELATNEQIKIQQQKILFLDKFTFDYTDDTVSKLTSIKFLLTKLDKNSLIIMDNNGVMNEITLSEIDDIKGLIALRRFNLHEQEMKILSSAKNGNYCEIKYS
jgi:hypothetical protein